MSERVVCEGDRIVFHPMFGQRIVTLEGEATMTASGMASVAQRKIAVTGDEKRQRWQARYTLFGYTGGEGVVEIIQLTGGQISPCTTAGGPMILEGQDFLARFTPTVPAVLADPPNTPDTMVPSIGQGYFIAQQNSVTVSR